MATPPLLAEHRDRTEGHARHSQRDVNGRDHGQEDGIGGRNLDP
jgi:hypothetical protein